MPLDDTIAALATALGTGGIAIVRMSGKKAYETALKMCPLLTTLEPQHMTYTSISDPNSQVAIDAGYVVYFKAPASFTGEDIIEFHVHGSTMSIQSVLEGIQATGARLALAGEFSKRAFINGKLNLTQAESIIELIESKNEQSHQVALDHYKGKMHRFIQQIRRQLLGLFEQIEGSIDFPDEVPSISHSQAEQTLAEIQKELKRIITSHDFGRFIRSGIHTVIVGKPNGGKSSLFNALLGEDKAIITDIPGTTRDYLEATMRYQKIHINLVDTAGYRASSDPIEQLGIDKMKQWIARADCMIWVLDQSCEFDEDDQRMWTAIQSHDNVCICLNKTDLPQKMTVPDDIQEIPIFSCSVLEQKGLNSLLDHVYDACLARVDVADSEYICNMRQLHCIKRAAQAVANMRGTMQDNQPDDLIAVDCRTAILALGEITGDELNEEMLDGVFSRFCVGK